MTEMDIICNPCEEDGESKPAEGFCVECQHYLCDQCFQFHRLPKPMRHHMLLSMDEMVEKEVARNQLELCPKHEDQMIKYYCKSHETVGCNSCMLYEHDPCGEVSILENIAEGVEKSSQYKELCSRMTETNDKLAKQIATAKQNTDVVTSCCKAAIDEVNTLQEQICKQFDVLRQQITKEAEEMKNEVIERAEHLEESVTGDREKLKNLQTDMKVLEQTKQSKLLFLAIIRSKEKQTDIEKRLEEVTRTNKVKRFCFVPNHFMMCMLQNIDALGELSTYDDGESPSDLKGSYGNYPDYGILKVVTGSNHSLILDTIYNSVKLYETEKRKCITEKKLTSCPWDVTPVDDNRIAVTLPNEKKIKLLLVSNDSISESHDIKVDARCEGIAHNGDQLFVACNKPAKILFLNMKGDVIRNITYTDDSGDSLFEQPAYITFHEKQRLISVSDRKTGSLTLMDMNGTRTHFIQHGDLKLPLSVEFEEDSSDRISVLDFERHAFEFNLSTGSSKEIITNEYVNEFLEKCAGKMFLCIWKEGECIL